MKVTCIASGLVQNPSREVVKGLTFMVITRKFTNTRPLRQEVWQAG